MIFSILIPVYNVERYVKQCVESVLAQDFPDYEVILVNDGSTDSGASICRKLAQKDKRIKYFEKKNEGLLQTRRYSIKQASGEYLLFLDSDDFWEPGLLTTLYSEILNRELDMICYRFRRITDTGRRISEDRGLFPDRTLFTAENKEIFIKMFVSTSRLTNLWTKCVRRTIVDVDADYISFKDKKGEDLLQSIPLIRNAESILYLDDVFVNYRMSRSGRGRNFKLQYLDDDRIVMQVLKDNLVQMNSTNEVMDCFYTRYIDGLMSFMDSVVSVSCNLQVYRKICSRFRRFPLYREARQRVTPSSIKSIKHRVDYILLENNQYFFLYHMHRIKNQLKCLDFRTK